jgi:hypothetical protein
VEIKIEVKNADGTRSEQTFTGNTATIEAWWIRTDGVLRKYRVPGTVTEIRIILKQTKPVN